MFVLFFTIATFSCILIFIILNFREKSFIKSEFQQLAETQLLIKQRQYKGTINELKQQLASLENSTIFSTYLQEPNSSSRALVEELFFQNAYAKPFIRQMRYLNRNGHEAIRVDQSKSNIFVVSQEKLQDKSNRYYTQKTQELQNGEFYVSNLDLNIEHGAIVTPYEPTLRISKPIYVEDSYRGFLIINIDAQEMIDRMLYSSEFEVMMTDDKGNYLIHTNAKKAWSGILKKTAHLKQDYPNTYTRLLKGVSQPEEYLYSTVDDSAETPVTFILQLKNKIIDNALEKANKTSLYISLLLLTAASLISWLIAKVLSRNEQIIQERNKQLQAQKRLAEKRTIEAERAREDLKVAFDKTKALEQENLEYASYMQSSFLPDDRELKQCFNDYLIIHSKKSPVSPISYFLKQINKNEHLLLVVNSKLQNIKGAFFSLVLNTIEKEMFQELQKLEYINSLWIFKYFKQAIYKKMHQYDPEGFNLAVFCYNEKDSNIKVTGNNISIWYELNGEIKQVATSMMNMEEVIIDFEDQIKCYVNSGNDNITIETIQSSLSESLSDQKNLFSKEIDHSEDNLFFCFEIDNKTLTILEYEGHFEQSILGRFAETVEEKVENISALSNIMTLIAEQFQNVMNYSKSENVHNNDIVAEGYLGLQDSKTQYIITSRNILTLADKEKIEPKLEEIAMLDRQGIRKRYKELRRSGENTHSKGGGFGFYEIAKNCNEMLHEFEKINDDRYVFTLQSVLYKV